MLNLVILGGGKGERLKTTFKKSKILAKVSNKTLLNICLDEYNFIKNKYLIINEKQNDIKKYVKKNLDKKVKILTEKKYLGDGGALSNLKQITNYKNKKFLVIYGDLISSVDIERFYKSHLKNSSLISIICHPNTHPFDSDLVDCNDNGKVKKFHFKPHKTKTIGNLALSGIYIIDGKIISRIKKKKTKLKDILLTNLRHINIYRTREFIKDLGTTKRLLHFRRKNNIADIKLLNFKKKIPAIFLDKDGVINKENTNDNYHNIFNFFPKTIAALKKATKMNYILIIITNQPAVAKGQLKISQLENMFKEFLTISSNSEIKIYKIYFCPHHPDKGFKGEIKKLKIKCKCRKPNSGMIEKAIKEFNIDRKESIFIGNHLRDYLASNKAKIKYLHIYNKRKIKFVRNNKQFNNLYNAINFIKKKNDNYKNSCQN